MVCTGHRLQCKCPTTPTINFPSTGLRNLKGSEIDSITTLELNLGLVGIHTRGKSAGLEPQAVLTRLQYECRSSSTMGEFLSTVLYRLYIFQVNEAGELF